MTGDLEVTRDTSQGRRVGTADAIRKRLDRYVTERYGSRYRLARHFEGRNGVSRLPLSTINGWFKESTKRVPNAMTLAPLVEEGLSLDWLLTGIGYPVWSGIEGEPSAIMLAVIRTELAQKESADQDEFNDCWSLLVGYRQMDGSPTLLRLAVEGVRPAFRELLVRRRQLYRLLADKRLGSKPGREALRQYVQREIRNMRPIGFASDFIGWHATGGVLSQKSHEETESIDR
jgi:hypothetical protein